MAKYFNMNGTDITNRVDEGKTVIYTSKEYAEEVARKKRSYAYQIFRERDKVRDVVFGVPK